MKHNRARATIDVLWENLAHVAVIDWRILEGVRSYIMHKTRDGYRWPEEVKNDLVRGWVKWL